MMPVCSSSDSSDNEENLKLLREAVDPTFANRSHTIKTDTRNLKSLRKTQVEDDQFNELNVTPEFQKHVAARLSHILDKKLADQLTETPTNTNKLELLNTVGCAIGGVKLLRSSKTCLDVDFIDNDPPKRKRAKHKKVKNEDFKEAAIEPERILNQEEIKHWTKLYTKPHFVYKKNTATGEFVLVPSNDQLNP